MEKRISNIDSLFASERKCVSAKCKHCIIMIYITRQCTETITTGDKKSILKTFKSKLIFKKIHSNKTTLLLPLLYLL